MREYLGVARKEGITEEEIAAAQAIVMAVSAGRVRAQLAEAQGHPPEEVTRES
jgi:hypothetical protein